MSWTFLSRGFIFLPGEFHVLYTVLGVAKSDMIDRLSLSLFLSPETLPTHTIGGILYAKGLQPQKSSLPIWLCQDGLWSWGGPGIAD